MITKQVTFDTIAIKRDIVFLWRVSWLIKSYQNIYRLDVVAVELMPTHNRLFLIITFYRIAIGAM